MAYVGYYVSVVPEQFTPVTARLVGEFADTMLGTTLVSGLVGGPWRGTTRRRPTRSPTRLVGGAPFLGSRGRRRAYAWLRRIRTGRALLLFLGYVGGTFLLVLTSRARAGRTLGTDSRYLSDIPLVAALCLGLAFIDLPGAPGSSAPGRTPSSMRPPASSSQGYWSSSWWQLASSFTTYDPGTATTPPITFFDRFRAEVEARGRTDMVDRVVPEDVMSQLAAPANNFGSSHPLVTDKAHFPDVSSDLAIVGDDGSLRQVAIGAGSTPSRGPSRAADGG